MVMHPSPGHYSGTLVNALLHHCQLPAMQLRADSAPPLSLEAAAAAAAGAAEGRAGGGGSDGGSSDGQGEQPAAAGGPPPAAQHPASAAGGSAASLDQGSQLSSVEADSLDEEEDEEGAGFTLVPSAGGARAGDATIRPGIVHRLDKGTTGLLVVAKTDAAHLSLAQQASKRGTPRPLPLCCHSATQAQRGCCAPLLPGDAAPASPLRPLAPTLQTPLRQHREHRLAPITSPSITPLHSQFKDRTVSRTYQAITLGVPRPPEGRVATNVGRWDACQ